MTFRSVVQFCLEMFCYLDFLFSLEILYATSHFQNFLYIVKSFLKFFFNLFLFIFIFIFFVKSFFLLFCKICLKFSSFSMH